MERDALIRNHQVALAVYEAELESIERTIDSIDRQLKQHSVKPIPQYMETGADFDGDMHRK